MWQIATESASRQGVRRRRAFALLLSAAGCAGPAPAPAADPPLTIPVPPPTIPANAVPAFAEEAVRDASHLDITCPAQPCAARWRELADRIETMRPQIQRAGRERNAVIFEAAKARWASGDFDQHAFQGKPSRPDPEWYLKWLWLEPMPREQRSMRILRNDQGGGVACIARFLSGDDAAVARKQGLIDRLRTEVEGR